MKSRGAFAKVAVPVVAAAAVGTVAFIGASANSPSDTGSSPSSGKANSAKAAEAIVGDPDDPATWRLPIEVYMPTKVDTRLISGARDSLIDECMKSAGYEQWTPAPDLPELGGKTLTDWRYGVHDARQAAERGYHPEAAEQKEYDEAMEAGAVDDSGADEEQLKNCASKADGQVPAASSTDLAQQISGDAYRSSKQEPSVVDAFAKWTSCMSEKGYSYKQPMEASDDSRFSDPSKVTDLEIATAKDDVACRDRYNVEKTWFDAEVSLQQKAIADHQDELDDVKADNKASVAKASAIVK